MNKAALIERVAKDAGITKNAAAIAVNSVIEGITDALQENRRMTLSGLGSWGVFDRKARTGRNPKTGEEISIQAKKAVRFKVGKQLEGRLNTLTEVDGDR